MAFYSTKSTEIPPLGHDDHFEKFSLSGTQIGSFLSRASGRALTNPPLSQHPSRWSLVFQGLPGVTGPDNDQDQTMTTLFGHSLVLKF